MFTFYQRSFLPIDILYIFLNFYILYFTFCFLKTATKNWRATVQCWAGGGRLVGNNSNKIYNFQEESVSRLELNVKNKIPRRNSLNPPGLTTPPTRLESPSKKCWLSSRSDCQTGNSLTLTLSDFGSESHLNSHFSRRGLRATVCAAEIKDRK